MAQANQMAVNTAEIRSAVGSITTLKDNYHTYWTEVFNQFANIDANWDGDDNAEFNDKVNSFKLDFEAMDQYFENLIQFLNATAEEYDRAEQERKQAAGALAK